MRGHAPKGFEKRPAADLKPGDKIWFQYDGERSVKEVEVTDWVWVTLRSGRRKRFGKFDTAWSRTPSANESEVRMAAAVAAVESYTEDPEHWLGVGPDVKARATSGRSLLDHVRERNRWSKDSNLSDNFTSADLQRAVKQGLILMSEHTWYGRSQKTYTSLSAEAAAVAERSLTDQQRLDRFMNYFVPTYEENRHERGDNPRFWPTGVHRYGDGRQLALDAGLIIETGKDYSNHPSYVPATHYDAFTEALAAHDEREAKRKAHFEDVQRRLLSFAGESGRGFTVTLHVTQCERLLELLEGSHATSDER